MKQTENHPNVHVLEKLYADFCKQDWNAFLEACPEHITFQVAGKSKLAGKYTQKTFIHGFANLLKELSGDTFQIEVHDILASDRHATVLATAQVTQNGKKVELRTVHVWRMEQGKPVAWYEYPRDLYQFDQVWS